MLASYGLSIHLKRRGWIGNILESKRVFVTGATGLMGGWLVKALLREGAEVVALVRDQTPKSMLVTEGILSQIAVVSGDLESLPTMQSAIAEYEPPHRRRRSAAAGRVQRVVRFAGGTDGTG